MTLHCTTLGMTPSFGFGDRIGLATPGHVAAMREAGAGMAPIFPQQSIREMTRTSRTAAQVMNDALRGAEQSGWTGVVGADADHLKTPADVDVTAAVGFTFFTIDPSGHVDQKADDYSEALLKEKFAAVTAEVPWIDGYRGRPVVNSRMLVVGVASPLAVVWDAGDGGRGVGVTGVGGGSGCGGVWGWSGMGWDGGWW